jgi:hypothetical protein
MNFSQKRPIFAERLLLGESVSDIIGVGFLACLSALFRPQAALNSREMAICEGAGIISGKIII